MTDSPNQTLVRLSKLMSERGLCSRREADVFIERGWVLVDGAVVDQLGFKVSPTCQIQLAPSALRQQDRLVTLMLNKPVGWVSAQPEKGYSPAIQLITEDNQFRGLASRLVGSRSVSSRKVASHSPSIKWGKLKPEHFHGLAVVGRLDIDSQGLLLFTQDGRLAKKIIDANSDVEKEYLVRFQGELNSQKLSLLRHGLELDNKSLKRAQVEPINADQLRFVLREGKKRQIRRMMELVDLQVTGLKRVRIGKLRLSDLPEGQWRFVDPDELIV